MTVKKCSDSQILVYEISPGKKPNTYLVLNQMKHLEGLDVIGKDIERIGDGAEYAIRHTSEGHFGFRKNNRIKTTNVPHSAMRTIRRYLDKDQAEKVTVAIAPQAVLVICSRNNLAGNGELYALNGDNYATQKRIMAYTPKQIAIQLKNIIEYGDPWPSDTSTSDIGANRESGQQRTTQRQPECEYLNIDLDLTTALRSIDKAYEQTLWPVDMANRLNEWLDVTQMDLVGQAQWLNNISAGSNLKSRTAFINYITISKYRNYTQVMLHFSDMDTPLPITTIPNSQCDLGTLLKKIYGPAMMRDLECSDYAALNQIINNDPGTAVVNMRLHKEYLEIR